MLKAIEGIYNNGKIHLAEIPANIPPKTRVIVTFLESSNSAIENSPPYHDLDHLCGTWTEAEAAQFIINTKSFEAIDQTLWQ